MALVSPLLLAPILLVACNQPPTPTPTYSSLGILKGNPQRTGVYPDGGSPQLGGVLWEYKSDSADIEAPIVANGMVYVMLFDLKSSASKQGIYQFAAETGELIATYSAENGSTPTVVSHTIYYSDSHGSYALDTSSGTASHKFSTGNEILGYAPLILDNSIFFGDYNRPFFAIDAASGKQKWKFVGGSGYSVAAGADNMIYVTGAIEALIMGGTDAFGQNNLFALDAQTGKQMWRFEPPISGQKALNDPIVLDGVVYCANYSNFQEPQFVYALDAKSGTRLWAYTSDDELRNTGLYLAGDKDQLFIATSKGDNDPYNYGGAHPGGSLIALDSKTGKVNWTFKTDTGLRESSISNGTIYVVGYDKAASVIYGIDAQTGNVLHKFQNNGRITSPLAIENGIVYFTANNKTLVAVK